MRVGSVKTRPGRPTIACEPNRAIAFTKTTSAPDRMAGVTSGPVTAAAVRPPTGVEDLRRFLHGRVHRLERARREQIHERERVGHGDEDQARHRKDVERQDGNPAMAGRTTNELLTRYPTRASCRWCGEAPRAAP